MIRRRRRRGPPPEPLPDDGLVSYHGGLYEPGFVEFNSDVHMDGFDELPKAIRDAINYAPTPEEGARPTRMLVTAHRSRIEQARKIARVLAHRILREGA